MARIKTSRQEKTHTMTERLLDWREEARRAGRARRGEVLLLLAWRAYDRLRARGKKAASLLSHSTDFSIEPSVLVLLSRKMLDHAADCGWPDANTVW
jgi:hypothetical protein